MVLTPPVWQRPACRVYEKRDQTDRTQGPKQPVTHEPARMSTAGTIMDSRAPFATPSRLPLPLRLTYAITPPNQSTPVERRRAIAAAQSERVSSLPVDALLIYDVQDESVRNANPRPFPFVRKVDPLVYATEELRVGGLPLVVYRTVVEQDEETLCRWRDRLRDRGGFAVLVGAPSRHASPSLTLSRAFAVWRQHTLTEPFGGVVIPERHLARRDEHLRLLAKAQQGCRFFVSQTVWSVGATKSLLRDLRARAETQGAVVPPILLTFSPCGSLQTLEFMEWLGVDVPRLIKRELLMAKDMLARSVELATQAAAEVCGYAATQGLTVGVNVESVSSRASEIDASVELVHRIDRVVLRPELGALHSI